MGAAGAKIDQAIGVNKAANYTGQVY